MGLGVLFATCAIVVVGFLALGGMSYKDSTIWAGVRFLRLKAIHKYGGYALIITSQVSIFFGIIVYNQNNGNYVLCSVCIGLFMLFWAVLEIAYQVKARGSDPIYNLDVIDERTYSERIRKGELLVVLDDLVIDVSTYIEAHPGGKAMLLSNIGRDISKYFYGGYSMSKILVPYAHSKGAVMITKRLAIGRLGREA